jgi:hypothetical protein
MTETLGRQPSLRTHNQQGKTKMLRLVKFAHCKETIAVLRMLLHKALEGRLRGIAVCFRTPDGDQVLATGIYGVHPEAILTAAARLKFTAAHQLEL